MGVFGVDGVSVFGGRGDGYGTRMMQVSHRFPFAMILGSLGGRVQRMHNVVAWAEIN